MAQIDDFKAQLIGGGARANQFRVTITPKHSASDVESFVRSLDKVWSGLNLKRLPKVSNKVESKVSKIY